MAGLRCRQPHIQRHAKRYGIGHVFHTGHGDRRQQRHCQRQLHPRGAGRSGRAHRDQWHAEQRHVDRHRSQRTTVWGRR
ncbi:hypothetical protein PSH58_13475 [Pseudomonas hefeiensis]|nr:hypothetical protein [Pseudomonas sp. FP53]WLH98530.1 hypothetical protein PSH58_13475 [Pseudomonas sp. FP53]